MKKNMVPAVVSFLLLMGCAGWVGAATVPQVRLKVAEYSRRLDFSLPEGGVWVAGTGGATGKIPAGAACGLSGEMTVPARLNYHVMVESVPMRESEKTAQALQKWRASGHAIHTLQLGKISLAADGQTPLYDGRILYIGVGRFPTREPAQKVVDELAANNTSSWILEETLASARGSLTLYVAGKRVWTGADEITLKPAGVALLKQVEHARGYSWNGFADRRYRGPLVIRWGARNALDGILLTDLETVLAGVVPSEISPRADLGALQAQAVAARGEILSKVGLRHLNEGFDFCSEQHCQVYSGETPDSVRIAQVIAPTVGLLLKNAAGGIVDAVYAANCGGHSEANHLVWTSPPDDVLAGGWDCPKPLALDLTDERQVKSFILQPPPALWCGDGSVEGGDKFRWRKTLGEKEWPEVEAKGQVGRLRGVRDLVRGRSGRVIRLTIDGENGSRTLMKELAIRQLFGGLRSSCFVVTWKTDREGFLNGAEFQGAGWGHGVGMCQTGAQSMAKKGVPFAEILLHYFPGARLEKNY